MLEPRTSRANRTAEWTPGYRTLVESGLSKQQLQVPVCIRSSCVSMQGQLSSARPARARFGGLVLDGDVITDHPTNFHLVLDSASGKLLSIQQAIMYSAP